ncbi:MAG: dephospho-CoA kinase [Oscillospiraceae bacterium]|jgi:dephospho-CoA kinase|nr:dephospho-CoA kinase [Oscillospiraceae bacterium]
MRNYKLIGLTGPTGSGKTSVAKCLSALGCYVIDADKLYAENVLTNWACKKLLSLEFGTDIIDSNGEVDKKLLAQRAFANPQNTAKLNEVTHPFIYAEMIKVLNNLKTESFDIIILDAAVLFESGCDILCDKTISVLASKQKRITRIMQRDNITEEQATLRMAAQQEDEFYIDRADIVFYNDDSFEDLKKQIEQIFDKIS